jgi:transglutaminase-like putative cysteine protease
VRAWARLQALPQQARETLFLLLVVAWVLLPHMAQLPVWASALAGLLLLWRGRLALTGGALPARLALAALLGLAVAGTLWTHRSLVGSEAGVTLVALLLALKTLEIRARRDAFVVFFLGFFTVLTQCLVSQSLLTAAYMLAAILGLLTALVSAHLPGSAAPLRVAARTAARVAALGLPLMALLFVLFPRIAPLWGVGEAAPRARSGLSATVSVGSMAELALDESVALRLRFDTPPAPGSALYFRGPVLGRFDGREWTPMAEADERASRPPALLQTQGAPLRYEVTMEPSSQPWLLVLDATPDAPQAPGLQARATPDLQWQGAPGAGGLQRYQAQSYLQFEYGPRQWSPDLRPYTALPPGGNPRTLEWAAALRASPALANADARTLSAAVLQRLGNGEYSYTLSPGVYSEHTADDFWFERKAGFCEHIASAYVVAMRALGVPARLVTGYQGAQRNAIDGYWTVRQSDAHAWAEIWQAGQGWTRVDPTATVSPWRLGADTRLAAPAGPVAQLLGRTGAGAWGAVRAAWEAVNNQWNQSVLNFGQGAQMALLKRLGFTAPRGEDLAYVLAAVMVLGGGLGALWAAWPGRRPSASQVLLRQLHRQLRSLGWPQAEHLSPRQIAQQLEQQFGPSAQPVCAWLLQLERWRYGPDPDAAALGALQAQWKSLIWPQRPSLGPG